MRGAAVGKSCRVVDSVRGGSSHTGATGENGERAGLKSPEWALPSQTTPQPQPTEEKKQQQINKTKRERQECEAGAFTEGRAEVFI